MDVTVLGVGTFWEGGDAGGTYGQGSGMQCGIYVRSGSCVEGNVGNAFLGWVYTDIRGGGGGSRCKAA